jgi:hypothetical protein
MATNLVYRALQTAITFKESGGSAVLTLNNLAHGAGRISARYDRGAGSQPEDFLLKSVLCWETAGVVGERVEIYIVESDGTDAEGALGTADAAWTDANIKPNLRIACINTTQATTGDAKNVASRRVTITERYFSIAVWSASAASHLQADDNASYIILTPVPPDVQAAA